MSTLCHAASNLSGQLLNEGVEGLGVLGPHVEHMHTFLEMLSTPMQHVLLCSTSSRVCVMDGLLTDSSDANTGLSACAGSGPCKLNLSAPSPLL